MFATYKGVPVTSAGIRATRPAPGGAGLALAVLSAATFGTSGAFASALIDAGWSPAAAVLARLVTAALMLTIPAMIQLRGRWALLGRSAGRRLAVASARPAAPAAHHRRGSGGDHWPGNGAQHRRLGPHQSARGDVGTSGRGGPGGLLRALGRR